MPRNKFLHLLVRCSSRGCKVTSCKEIWNERENEQLLRGKAEYFESRRYFNAIAAESRFAGWIRANDLGRIALTRITSVETSKPPSTKSRGNRESTYRIFYRLTHGKRCLLAIQDRRILFPSGSYPCEINAYPRPCEPSLSEISVDLRRLRILILPSARLKSPVRAGREIKTARGHKPIDTSSHATEQSRSVLQKL